MNHPSAFRLRWIPLGPFHRYPAVHPDGGSLSNDRRAEGPRFARFRGGLRVGADYFARVGAVASDGASGSPPRGLVDRMSDLANPDIDVARVHPAIVVFFEDTARLELHIRSHWRFPISLVWRLVRPLMQWIGQFVLPLREAMIATRILALDPARDGRGDARAVIREYAGSGAVMQVVAYATWESGGARFMSATFPLPGGHVAGILRLDRIAEDSDGRLAVALTSASRKGDGAGIWYVLGSLALRAPLGERLSLWAAATDCAPADMDVSVLEGTTILGRHEQRAFGVRFVTHEYWFRPVRRG